MSEERPLAIGFSDLRGFTSYTAERGDREAYRLANAFIEMAEEQAAQEGGAVLKTYGDGVMTSFEAPEGAVRYAIGMQRALRSFNESREEEPISAGIGLTWGPAIRTGGDLFGHSVNLAKRLADIAKGGQIVVSSSLYGLLKAQGDLSFRDLGERRIKGLGAESLYELIWQDEVANIHLPDDSLDVLLTEGGKLVLQFAKPIEEKLLLLKEKIESQPAKSAAAEAFKRRLTERLMERLPKWLEAVERLAGMGVEYPLEEVEVGLVKGRLTITLPNGRRLRFRKGQIDADVVQRFLEKFQELRGSPGRSASDRPGGDH